MKAPSDSLRYRQNTIEPTRRERRYLAVLWHLQQRHSPVLAVHLVRWLAAPAPTVSQVLRLLERKAYIQRSERGDIVLTEEGAAQARQIVYRHRLLECFLFKVVLIPWHLLHREALELEPVMSGRLEQLVREQVASVRSNPYGQPLNGAGYPAAVRLSHAHAGQLFAVQWIDEAGEEDDDLLYDLGAAQVVPGVQVEVLQASPLRGVQLRSQQHIIELDAGRACFVCGSPQPPA